MAQLTREGSGVVNNAIRHLSFLDSEMVARAVTRSTFNPEDLLDPGTTVYVQIPPEQLEAQRGLLRCWMTSLVRIVGAGGDECKSETLFLIDEAEILQGLPALKEMLVRGRSSGARSIQAYQSDSQVKAAFKDQPSLIYDNCSVQIYLGAASSYETGERLSKTLGDFTQVLETYNENESESSSYGSSGNGQHSGNSSRSRGHSFNYSEAGRALARPEELLTQSRDRVIVLQSGADPIIGNRVKWYQEREFNPAARRVRGPRRPLAMPGWLEDFCTPFWRASPESIRLRLVLAAVLAFILWAMVAWNR